MDAVKLRSGLQIVMSISARGNLYLQQSGLGNALLAENPKRCAQIVLRGINLIYALSAVVYPFMPSTSESILSQLNAPARTVPSVLGNDILPGHTIGASAYLFKRIEEKQADIWRARFGGGSEVGAAVANGAGVAKTKTGGQKKKEKASKAPVDKTVQSAKETEAVLEKM